MCVCVLVGVKRQFRSCRKIIWKGNGNVLYDNKELWKSLIFFNFLPPNCSLNAPSLLNVLSGSSSTFSLYFYSRCTPKVEWEFLQLIWNTFFFFAAAPKHPLKSLFMWWWCMHVVWMPNIYPLWTLSIDDVIKIVFSWFIKFRVNCGNCIILREMKHEKKCKFS